MDIHNAKTARFIRDTQYWSGYLDGLSAVLPDSVRLDIYKTLVASVCKETHTFGVSRYTRLRDIGYPLQEVKGALDTLKEHGLLDYETTRYRTTIRLVRPATPSPELRRLIHE